MHEERKRGRVGCSVGTALLAVLTVAVLGTFAFVVSTLLDLFPAGYTSPYTWSNLSWTSDNRPVYTEEGVVASKLGIDVSAYDKDIDWEAVAHDGIEFAIIRAAWRGYTEGGLNEDVNFRTNITQAHAAGLQLGVYLFSSAISEDEAREEARFVLGLLQETGIALDLPVVFDHEPVPSSDGRANSLDRETITSIAHAFCQEIEAAGLPTMIYGNPSDLARYDESVTANRPVWLAHYDTAHPTVDYDFSLWQYTSTGVVAGITRNVDLDVWFTTTIPLEKYTNTK